MTRIGQYEISSLLGQGGIGQVHLAVDTVLGREVAIKSLRPELMNDEGFVTRFRSEATNLAKLNHPNITTLYALLTEHGGLHMVMEAVRGATIEAILAKRGGRLDTATAVDLIAQAGEGLSYAHSAGIIHRDIKPSNLMVTAAGVLKIMDFGIARVQGGQRLTRDGSIIGTLAYMAPEQLRGGEGDQRSDLYGLATVFYEMLTGRTPFKAATDYDLMQAQISQVPLRPSAIVTGVRGPLDAVILKALEKSPDKRFATVAAFVEAVRAAAGETARRTDLAAMMEGVAQSQGESPGGATPGRGGWRATKVAAIGGALTACGLAAFALLGEDARTGGERGLPRAVAAPPGEKAIGAASQGGAAPGSSAAGQAILSGRLFAVQVAGAEQPAAGVARPVDPAAARRIRAHDVRRLRFPQLPLHAPQYAAKAHGGRQAWRRSALDGEVR